MDEISWGCGSLTRPESGVWSAYGVSSNSFKCDIRECSSLVVDLLSSPLVDTFSQVSDYLSWYVLGNR